MSTGGMTTSKKSIFFILVIPLAAIAAVFVAANFELAYDIIVHGKIGTCVWPGDYVDHMGGSMDDLVYNEDFECYQMGGR